MRVLFVLFWLTLSAAANATFLYAEDGTQISKGDPVAKVNIHLGPAPATNYQNVCVKTRGSYCKAWARVETRQYFIDGYYWTVNIMDGRVSDMKWSR
ncbi:MAG: hypothetical protein AXW15_07835 [Neptuniibacter sp. Phe_28]|nr:MAG: hypothetical protein AXW15_07835 [Neptuniibacter sp. Phe_28]